MNSEFKQAMGKALQESRSAEDGNIPGIPSDPFDQRALFWRLDHQARERFGEASYEQSKREGREWAEEHHNGS